MINIAAVGGITENVVSSLKIDRKSVFSELKISRKFDTSKLKSIYADFPVKPIPRINSAYATDHVVDVIN